MHREWPPHSMHRLPVGFFICVCENSLCGLSDKHDRHILPPDPAGTAMPVASQSTHTSQPGLWRRPSPEKHCPDLFLPHSRQNIRLRGARAAPRVHLELTPRLGVGEANRWRKEYTHHSHHQYIFLLHSVSSRGGSGCCEKEGGTRMRISETHPTLLQSMAFGRGRGTRGVKLALVLFLRVQNLLHNNTSGSKYGVRARKSSHYYCL